MNITTHALMKETLLDYGVGNVSAEMKADIDQCIQLIATRKSQRAYMVVLFSIGNDSAEISTKLNIPRTIVEEELTSAIAWISEQLAVRDIRLYHHTDPKRHGQLSSFLAYYDTTYLTDLQEIIHGYRST